MNDALWNQTVDVATGRIPELAGVEVSADAYRTDLAQAAVDNLSDMDTSGHGYSHRSIDLREGGE
ncbi:MAG: hypothetical protein WCE80_00585 [Acidimicrobiia bacterium]